MFSVLADEGSVATGSTLLFAAAAFCVCAARPAVERHRAAVARITARKIFAILDLLRACSPFSLNNVQRRTQNAFFLFIFFWSGSPGRRAPQKKKRQKKRKKRIPARSSG